ncbi:MAG: hypothetical protein NT018_09035 [Armatimonadetes bacterium]|nr:hypothetical protein [Armatimonadota bacterium]
MATIEGKAKHEGVAIAVVAKVDSINGINGVDTAILEEGIRALRKGLARDDYPEVVVACDNVVMGISMKLPGINTIGIAAQTDMDVPGLDVDLPCVIGLPGLLDGVGQGSLMIIDGNKGVVHIDPDPHIIIHYQHIEEDRQSRSKVFIASEHIPARTQAGETVYVYAYITNEGEVEQALDEGADGLLVDLRGSEADVTQFYKALIRAAPGKPIVFGVDSSCKALMEAAADYAAPGQVTVAFPTKSFDELYPEVVAAIKADPDAVHVKIGCMVKGSESCISGVLVNGCVVDMRKSPLLKDPDIQDLALKVVGWIDGRDPETAILVMGKQIDSAERLIEAGTRSLAVSPYKVGAMKYKIRAMGTE